MRVPVTGGTLDGGLARNLAWFEAREGAAT
jgi:hypothetical protein